MPRVFKNKFGVRVFKLVDLSKAIKDVIEIPGEDRKFIRFSKYHDITRIIINTIKKALQNGETVHIKGFGKFEIITEGKRRLPDCFPTKFAPARKVVRFRPSTVTRRFINEL